MKTTQRNAQLLFNKHKISTLIISSMLTLSGCATQNKTEPQLTPNTQAFTTQATVEYVLGCMNHKGKQTLTTMYQCTCRFDELAKQLNYEEYTQAITFTSLSNLTGDARSAMTDPPQSKILRNKLKKAEKEAKDRCELS